MHKHIPDPGDGAQNRAIGSQDSGKLVPHTMLRKLLLVDDEVDGAEIAAILLRSSGLQVVVAHSAADSLHVLENDEEIDTVLLDIVMPGMTGLQLANAVRTKYPAVKIVLMSGYAVPELLGQAKCNYLFVEKPYKIDVLLRVLHS